MRTIKPIPIAPRITMIPTGDSFRVSVGQGVMGFSGVVPVVIPSRSTAVSEGRELPEILHTAVTATGMRRIAENRQNMKIIFFHRFTTDFLC